MHDAERDPVPQGTQLTVAVARARGMLLSRDDAASAVEQLALVARDMVHSAVGAGASLIDESGRRTSAGSTDRIVALADQLQYDLGQGPCLSAWATWSVQHITDTADEPRWQAWSSAVAPLGVRSVISAPLIFKDQCIGAMKVYSTTAHAFTPDDERRLVLLAGAAATLLGVAQETHVDHELSASLRTALADRRAIETATGMLMERLDIGHTQARAALLSHSREKGRPVIELARAVMERSLGSSGLEFS